MSKIKFELLLLFSTYNCHILIYIHKLQTTYMLSDEYNKNLFIFFGRNVTYTTMKNTLINGENFYLLVEVYRKVSYK